jgi:hypothetical protein
MAGGVKDNEEVEEGAKRRYDGGVVIEKQKRGKREMRAQEIDRRQDRMSRKEERLRGQ